MTSITLRSVSGPDGKLHLELPVGSPNTEFEVELVVRPTVSGPLLPPGYFDLIGSVDDDTLVVHSQPPVPPPLDLE